MSRTPAGPRRLVVFCTHGIDDPLVSQLMLDYLLRLQRRTPGRQVLLFTEEPPQAVIAPDRMKDLLAKGIEWVPLRYDVSGHQWIQKLRSAWRMWRATRRFSAGKERTWLLGYLAFGGAYAVLLQQLGLGRAITVCFEPHSMYMAEVGHWRIGGLRFRFVSWLERLQLRKAHHLIVPTRAGLEQALRYRSSATTDLQGITIDVERSRFDAAQRMRFRAAHGLGDELLIAYVGKFGGIYHSMADYLTFAGALLMADPSVRFLVIAGNKQLEELRTHAMFAPVSKSFILHPPVPPSDLHHPLSAADLGVIAVPPTPAQAFRTPVKTAHYWAAGLPIIIPEGVSDDHWIARTERTGIVVDDLPVVQADELLGHARELLKDRPALRERCIAAALKYRDTSHLVALLERTLT